MDRPDLSDVLALGAPLDIALSIIRHWEKLTADNRRAVLFAIATQVPTRSHLPAGERLH